MSAGTGRRGAVLALAGAALLAASPCAAAARLPDFGSHSGYLERRDVRTISAQWIVPRSRGTGRASTWVGAPGDAVNALGTPFIQIGVDQGSTLGLGGRTSYLAFWSDTEHRFRAQDLFFVRAGDRVSAQMQRTPAGWRLSLRDLTTRHHVQFSTTDERRGRFGIAEWAQEDPGVTVRDLSRRKAYPRLGPVRITRVRLNGRAPSYGQVLSAWMTVRGRPEGPTPLRNGAFSIDAERIRPKARAYLAVLARYAPTIGHDETRFERLDASSSRDGRSEHDHPAACGFAVPARARLRPLAGRRPGGDRGKRSAALTSGRDRPCHAAGRAVAARGHRPGPP